MDWMEIFKSVRKKLRIFSPDTSKNLVSKRFWLFCHDGYRAQRIPRPVPRRPDFINLFVLARKSPLGKPRRKQNRIDKIGRSEQNPGGLCWIGRSGFRRSGPEMRKGDVRGLWAVPDLCPEKPCPVRVPDARMDWMEIFKSVRKNLHIFSPDTSKNLVSERFRLFSRYGYRAERIPPARFPKTGLHKSFFVPTRASPFLPFCRPAMLWCKTFRRGNPGERRCGGRV